MLATQDATRSLGLIAKEVSGMHMTHMYIMLLVKMPKKTPSNFGATSRGKSRSYQEYINYEVNVDGVIHSETNVKANILNRQFVSDNGPVHMPAWRVSPSHKIETAERHQTECRESLDNGSYCLF